MIRSKVLQARPLRLPVSLTHSPLPGPAHSPEDNSPKTCGLRSTARLTTCPHREMPGTQRPLESVLSRAQTILLRVQKEERAGQVPAKTCWG